MKRLFSYINVGRFSRKQRIHFFINIGVGIVIAVFFHFLEHTDWGEDVINKAFDLIVVKEAQKAAGGMESLQTQKNDNISDQIVFVDIDHEAYVKLGRPAITPRNELAKIVEAAYQGGARIVALDILLEERDCCHPEHDRALKNVFQKMVDRKVATKVIFPVRIGYDGDINKNLFNDFIDKHPNFYSALPTLSATATDRVIRYWAPYATVKVGSGQRILWNMSFLAAMLADGKAAEIKDFEETIKTGEFHEAHLFKLSSMKEITISPERDDIYHNRIRFLLIPKDTLPGHPGGNLFNASYRVDEVEHAIFKDKIVIIGNSSPDTGDIHPTPAGNMAGMYIIGNAVNTISLGIQPSHSSMILNLLIEVVIITGAAYLFLYFQSFLAQLLGSVVLIATLGTMSYYYFLHTGVFLNFIFAVIGMGFHKTIANIEEIVERRGIKINHH